MKSVEVLEKYWGHKQFRPLQEEIVNSILAGNDTLAILPTGGGKSVCFQVPGLLLGGITLVISPLISLMNDQVENLRSKNISALALHSGLSKKECSIEYQNLRNGKYKFVYVSPERLRTEQFLDTIQATDIRLLAVDEAHCISQWGYDFRPEYILISEFREIIKDCPCIALTASATLKVQFDITTQLQFKKGKQVYRQTIERKNLSYVVLNEEAKNERLLKVCKNIKGTGIVYSRNRKGTSDLAKFLVQNGIKADYYHAGLDYDEKIKKQTSWQNGITRVMVCTNAFGMGIDKGNVRFVVHYEMPDSPEAYYQEAGRAGRDGEESWCILLYCKADKISAENMLKSRFMDKKDLEAIYNALCNHLQIPYGGGFEENFELDTGELNRKYNFKSTEIYTAISMLQKEGLLKLSEAFTNPSRLRIVVTNTDIYAFYLKNPSFEIFIKTILRMYGGLFDNYIAISEYDLARNLKLSVNKVREILKRLTTLKLFDYLPQNEQPLITMLSERQTKLPFDKKRWQFLIQAAEERLQAMISYASKDQCRQNSLSVYFGENNSSTCGKCDVCRAKKIKPSEMVQTVSLALKKELSGTYKTMESILKFLNDEPSKIESLRFLMDSGQIIEKEKGHFTWKEI
jgi:ATP-dependent DNA helicase RecQ